jgi:ketosteroid isomerase-like protein
MSQENLDLVRSIYADWERGEYSRVDWAHPEIEFGFADGPHSGSRKGLAGLADTWRDFLSTWQELRAKAEEFREIDSQRVLVLAHNTGRGKLSGLEVGPVSMRGANLFHLRDGKVITLVNYWDRDRALADLGLPE